jgi:hypothetical protein
MIWGEDAILDDELEEYGELPDDLFDLFAFVVDCDGGDGVGAGGRGHLGLRVVTV